MTLEYEVLDNGWTVNVHTPIKDINESDKKDLLDLMIRNTCVFWRNQKLTPQEELDFCGSFGYYDFDTVNHEVWNTLSEKRKSLFYPEYPGILRVTAKPGLTGYPGHFDHAEDLEWHCNRPGDPNRKPFVYLYAVEGSKGSVTHWTNGMLAYNDLSEETKKYYETIEVQYYGTRWRKDLDTDQGVWRTEKDAELKKLNLRHKIIMSNLYGQKGIAMSPYDIGELKGMSEEEMINWSNDVIKYLTQPKYVYSHYWEDGDVIIGEQFFGLHKRDAFDKMHERYLHRIAFNADKLLPEMKYEGYGGYI